MIDPAIVVAVIGTVGTLLSGVVIYWQKRTESKENMDASFQQIAAELISDQVKSFASENEKLIKRIDNLANREKENERLIEELRDELFSMRMRILSVAATLQSLAQFAESLVMLYDVKDEDEFKEILRNHHRSIQAAMNALNEEERTESQ